jgi:hypothetical protein
LSGFPVDNFHAVLFGDVSGNWSATPSKSNDAAARPEPLSELPLLQAGSASGVLLREPASRKSVVVRAENAPPAVLEQKVRPTSKPNALEVVLTLENAAGMLSLDLDLEYGANEFSVVGVRTLDAAAGVSLVSNNDENGRLRLGLFSATGFEDSGAILAIEIQTGRRKLRPNLFKIRASANEGAIPVRLVSEPERGLLPLSPPGRGPSSGRVQGRR